jgi:hypothetical protein
MNRNANAVFFALICLTLGFLVGCGSSGRSSLPSPRSKAEEWGATIQVTDAYMTLQPLTPGATVIGMRGLSFTH